MFLVVHTLSRNTYNDTRGDYMKIPYEDEYKQLGLNIAYYRKKQGLTQENLAEMIDVSRTHMSRIETSYKSTVSLEVVFAIAKALDIAVAKLFEVR